MKLISIGTDRKIFEAGSGIQKRMIEYGKHFEEIHAVVFSLKNSGPKGDLQLKIGGNIWLYPTNSKNRLLYAWDAFKISKKIIHNSKFSIKDSVVSCQDPFETGLVGALVKLFFGLPLHIQIHTDLMNKYFWASSSLNKIRFLFAEFAIKYADRVRVVSGRIKKSIENFSTKTDVLPIKTGTSSPNPEARKKNGKNILTVCRIEPEKNLETAIRAFKEISFKFPDAVFTIVGDGSQKEKLMNLSVELGLKSKIKFAGWQENLSKYYEEADIYISTSLYEGYGMAAVEAASFGLPLVLSDTGVADDLFKNGQEALVCDALDPKGVAENILRILKDDKLATKLGESAKLAAAKHLNLLQDYYGAYAESVKKAAENFHKKNLLLRIINFKWVFWNSFIYLRYFICGLSSAAVNIYLLYLLTDGLGVWYLYSSVMAFVVSLIISFTLQKFVVFRDGRTERMHHQFYRFFIAALLGVTSNTVLVYLFTDIASIWYILSQVLAGIFVMVQNYLLYKFFIFK